MNDTWDPWTYKPELGRTPESGSIEGFHVHATDGDLGLVVTETNTPGSSRIVVDVGHFLFGRQVLLPASAVSSIDADQRKVYVDLTKDQIKHSPEPPAETSHEDPEYHGSIKAYYGTMFGG